MSKFIKAIFLILAFACCSSASAASVSDPCGIETQIINGEIHNFTEATANMCKENIGVAFLNVLYDPSLIADFAKKMFSPEGSSSFAMGFQLINLTNVILEAAASIFLYASLIIGLWITGKGLIQHAREGYLDPRYVRRLAYCVGAVIMTQPFIGATFNYTLTKTGLAAGNMVSTSIQNKEDVQAVRKKLASKLIAVKANNNANALIAIALTARQTKSYKDALAYSLLSKDYEDGSIFSFVKYNLSYKDFIQRLSSCSQTKPKYITETYFNRVWTEFDFSFTTKNTMVNFTHVDECEDGEFYYHPEIYGYAFKEDGYISYPESNTEQHYFATDDVKDRYPTLKKVAEIKSNYPKNFGNDKFSQYYNSGVASTISEKINNSKSIDTTTLENEAAKTMLFKECSLSADETLQSLAKSLNKTKASLFYDLTNTCKNALFGQNNKGEQSIDGLWNAAKEAAKLISKFGCGVKESGPRSVSHANANSYKPFTDYDTELLTPACYFYDEKGVQFNGILSQREEVEALKKIQLINNIISSYFYNVVLGGFNVQYDYFIKNEKDMTEEDRKQFGSFATYDTILNANVIRDKKSAMFDYNSSLMPEIKSTYPWAQQSNFVNMFVVNENQTVTDEIRSAINMPEFRLSKYLNGSDSTLSGVEYDTLNYRQNQDQKVSNFTLTKFISESLFDTFDTPTMLQCKGLDGGGNLANRTEESSLRKGLINFKGSMNTLVYCYVGNFEIIKTVGGTMIALTAIVKGADLIKGVATDAASLSGGDSQLSGLAEVAANAGGAVFQAFIVLAEMINQFLGYVLAAHILALAIMLWIVVEFIMMLKKAMFTNILANILVAFALLKSAAKDDDSGLEYSVRLIIGSIVYIMFVCMSPFLLAAVFIVVNAITWAYTCDVLNDIMDSMNNPAFVIIIKLCIFIIAGLQTWLASILSVSVIKELLSIVTHYTMQHAPNRDDTMSSAKAMGAGVLLGNKLTERKQELQNRLTKLRLSRGK